MVNAEFFDALEQLEKEKIPYFVITGETSKQKRQELVKEFNNGDVPVFLISLKAGGGSVRAVRGDHSRGGCRVQEQPDGRRYH